MPKLIGEYFDVKIGDSDTFQIPKVPFHKDEIMPDHGICEKLASQFDSNQNEITISLDDIPNEKLFEKLLDFSFSTKSSNTITILVVLCFWVLKFLKSTIFLKDLV